MCYGYTGNIHFTDVVLIPHGMFIITVLQYQSYINDIEVIAFHLKLLCIKVFTVKRLYLIEPLTYLQYKSTDYKY